MARPPSPGPYGRAADRFTVLWPRDGGMAMFAELAHFVVQLPDVELLRPSARAQLEALDRLRQQRLRRNLDALEQRGWWRRDDDERAPQPTTYLLPEFGAAPRPRKHPGRGRPWLTLCDPVQDAAIDALAATLAVPEPIEVVVADDLLDPRLDALDRQLRARGRPWLLLRLSGEHPTVGPVFGLAPDSPCWRCVAFRVSWNQPVRRWFHRTHPGPLAPIPVAWLPIEPRLPSFAAAAERMLAANETDRLLEIIDDRAPIEHPARRRPQCPRCGDPELYATTAGAPLVLAPAAKVWDEDGGVRTVPPPQTASALEPIVSPISGPVAGLRLHSTPGRDHNQIFRAWFCKTTYRPGLPAADAMFQTTLGKGMSAAQSRVSAISESIERLASNYHGDEPVIEARAADLPGRSFGPAALAPYSESQYLAFEATDPALDAAMHAMASSRPEDVIAWTPVWSLTRSERCYVPLTWCYANTPYDDDPRCRFFHNGGAAGNGLEEAILQGLLEIIERDAVAIWWYGRIRRPPVVEYSLPQDFARQLEATVGRHSETWVLDVTHDLGVPVFVAVSRRRDRGTLCLGFGCHLDPKLALRRALTELCQILEIRDQHSAPFDFDSIPADEFLVPDPRQAPIPLRAHPAPTSSDIADDIRTCVARASEHGLEVLALDYSRPDLPLRTAKVIVPGTCHLFPYRGASRLYEVPVRMGWRSSAITEAELNPLELLI